MSLCGLSMVGEFVTLDVPRKADRLQSANAVPIQVDFIPDNSVTRVLRNRVMIVVPPFAESKQRDP